MNGAVRLGCAVRVLATATTADRTVEMVASTDAVNTYG